MFFMLSTVIYRNVRKASIKFKLVANPIGPFPFAKYLTLDVTWKLQKDKHHFFLILATVLAKPEWVESVSSEKKILQMFLPF